MYKFSFCVNNLGNNQLTYFLHKQSNKYTVKDYKTDLIVFYQNPSLMIAAPSFAVMPIAELWGYDGDTIATDLTTATKMINSIGPRKKLFYVWDLEWTRNKNHNYSDLAKVYQSPEIELIARSKDHKQIIESCWNREVKAIVEDVDIEQFIKVINE